MVISDIVIIGSGNTAVNLAVAFRKIGRNISCVFSRDAVKAGKLAEKVGAECITDIAALPRTAGLYILAVSDDAIEDVVMSLPRVSGIVAHTSGSVEMSVFEKKVAAYGVFYPLMHLSAHKIIEFSGIPLCIEANNQENLEALQGLASALSNEVHIVSSEQRKILHLSAVFACNFTNLNYFIAEEILKKHHLPFSMLRPLILETAGKIKNDSPSKLQTGPAVRKDLKVIKEHIRLLENFPEYRKIYNLFTDLIFKKKNSHEL